MIIKIKEKKEKGKKNHCPIHPLLTISTAILWDPCFILYLRSFILPSVLRSLVGREVVRERCARAYTPENVLSLSCVRKNLSIIQFFFFFFNSSG